MTIPRQAHPYTLWQTTVYIVRSCAASLLITVLSGVVFFLLLRRDVIATRDKADDTLKILHDQQANRQSFLDAHRITHEGLERANQSLAELLRRIPSTLPLN